MLLSATSIIANLIHYWPIQGETRDRNTNKTGDLVPGTNIAANGSVGLGPDRFGNPTGAIYMNNGYYEIPNGVYFGGNFTILTWIKLISASQNTRLFDFSNGPSIDGITLRLVDQLSKPTPAFSFFHSSGVTTAISNFIFNLNQWYHVAGVIDGLNAFIYVNGTLQGYQNGSRLLPYKNRTKCYFGRSIFYPWGDADANAYFDEIKIYQRALTQQEILNDFYFF